jgi:hypothetical protein
MSQQAAALVQIGQLLTKSGLLSHEDLAEALIRAKEKGLPLGTVLLTMGRLRQSELRAAVEAQSLVNDGVLTSDAAITALSTAVQDAVTFEMALLKLGFEGETSSTTNKLGELLVDSGLISEDQLSEALATSAETGMPLGRVLTFKRICSEEFLLAALRAQRVIREGVVTRDEAVSALAEVKKRRITLEESLESIGFTKARPKRSTPLGYLLVEAAFLKEVSLMMCVEMSLSENKPIIDILVEQGFASRNLAQACLTVQQMVDAGTLSKDVACTALRLLNKENLAIDTAVAAAGLQVVSAKTRTILQDLFVLSGMVEPKEMPRLTDSNFVSYEEFCKTLRQGEKMSDNMVDAVARALYLLDQRLLTAEDAVMALHYCRKHTSSLDDALSVMGWKALRGQKAQ